MVQIDPTLIRAVTKKAAVAEALDDCLEVEDPHEWDLEDEEEGKQEEEENPYDLYEDM